MAKCKLSACFLVTFIFLAVATATAQLPCSAITRNPQMLDTLMEVQRASEAREQMEAESVVASTELSSLKFEPITIRPGDALYVEYKGRNFTINAEYSGGDSTAFDVPEKASEEQWRKGVLLLDHVMGLNQQLVRLSVLTLSNSEPQFRNVRFIRAGEPIFKFTKLGDGEAPRLRVAAERHIEQNCIPDANPYMGPPSRMKKADISVNPYVPGAASLIPAFYGNAVPMQPPATLPMAMTAYQSGTPAGGNHFKYTGKERDDESGLDNYGARMYASNMGRFITPDWSAKPAAIPYADLFDPQSLNLYSYVRNNPINKTDPDGHDGFLDNLKEYFTELIRPIFNAGKNQNSNSDASNNPSAVLDTHAAITNHANTLGRGVETVSEIAMVGDLSGLGSSGRNLMLGDKKGAVMAAGLSVALHDTTELHHLLPRQFNSFFKKAGLEIEDYTVRLLQSDHRLLPDGLHTGQNSWNVRWKDFIRKNPNANDKEVLQFLEVLKKDFNITNKVKGAK